MCKIKEFHEVFGNSVVTYCHLFSYLNPPAAVFFDTRYNSQGMNKVISRIKIDGTRITQPVQVKHTG